MPHLGTLLFVPIFFILVLLILSSISSSIPAGAAILDGPGKELELVFHENVARGTPMVRVGDLVLNVILDCQDTIDTVGVENVIYEHLKIAQIVLLSLEVNPVVELNGRVRKSVGIYSCDKDVVRAVDVED